METTLAASAAVLRPPFEIARERGVRSLFGRYRAVVGDRPATTVRNAWQAGDPLVLALSPGGATRLLEEGVKAPGRRIALLPAPEEIVSVGAVAEAAEQAGLQVLVLAPAGVARPPLPGRVVEIPDPAFLAARLQFAAAPDPFEPDPQPQRRRMLVSLHDPHDRQRWAAKARETSYLEFLRWEMARWFDHEHPKFQVRGFPLRRGVGSDDNRATLDTVMLMRHYGYARTLPEPPTLEAIVAAMGAGRPMVVTTQPDLAYFALARQVPTILVPLTMAERQRCEALGFGAAATEPYCFRADKASAIIVALHTSAEVREGIAAARKALAQQGEAARHDIAEWLG